MNIKGVDVSEHNGEVDYDYLISQGVKFSIVRFGFGAKRADYHYKANVENALAKGLDVGAYWLIYALDEAGARKNAEMFCELLEPYKGKLTYPIYADFEYDSEDYMRKNGVSPTIKKNTAIVKAFCEVVENHGWYVANYANPDYINNHFDNSQLEKYDLWLAHYGVSKPSIDCAMWQYGDEWGLDADICYVDYPTIIRQAGKNGFTPIEKKKEEISVDIDDLARRVLNGEFGNGAERRQNLGQNYEAVQAKVNELLKAQEQKETPQLIAGTYRCVANAVNVRNAPSLSGKIVAVYKATQTVVLDGWYTIADGFVWGRYIGASSGKYRYVAVRKDRGYNLWIPA